MSDDEPARADLQRVASQVDRIRRLDDGRRLSRFGEGADPPDLLGDDQPGDGEARKDDIRVVVAPVGARCGARTSVARRV